MSNLNARKAKYKWDKKMKIAVRIFLVLIKVSTMFYLNLNQVSASDLVFVDNFDQDLSHWQVARSQTHGDPSQPCSNNGLPAEWKIIDGQATIEITGSGCTTELIPTNLNLENKSYLYEFEWEFHQDLNMNRNVLVLWQDPKNWYGLSVVNSLITLQKVVNGREYTLSDHQAQYAFTTDTSYHFAILVSQRGQISVAVNGEPILNVQDTPTFIEGFRTIGLQASVGALSHSVTHFDNVRVTVQDPYLLELPVTLYRQDDPRWGSHEYDAAHSWAEYTSIHHWGCALTSMVMILQYYDISTLPDGQVLTPDSLNTWLQLQSDGYIGNGLLNWLAVTRLTRLVHEQRGTPKLEYRRVSTHPLAKAQEELTREHPVILHLNGHFIVGSGLSENPNDLVIKDPLFWYSFLSQHQTSLLSTRVFTPSLTDLSYILVVSDPSVQVQITDHNGGTLANVEQYSESIIDHYDGRGQTSPRVAITELAKPVAGRYIITLRSIDTETHDVFLYAYDKEGTPTTLQQTVLPAENKPLTVGLDFDPDALSSFDSNSPFTQLHKTLTSLNQQGGFFTPMLYPLLEYLARVGEHSPALYHLKILNTIQSQLETYPSLLTEFAKDVLLTQLEQLKHQLSPAE
jgi:hypothetical protein